MANLTPSKHFVEIVNRLKHSGSLDNLNIRIAEIGVDRGSTTRECIKLLENGDIYDLYDIDTCSFFKEIALDAISSKCIINIFKNTKKLYDSYAWSLAKLYRELVLNSTDPKIYDAVYLDGAHTYPADAPATCFLKELIKIGGIICFDDMHWTLSKSPTCNTDENRKLYTQEQMTTPHVSLIVDTLMRTDRRYRELTDTNDNRSVFLRIS